MANHSEYGTKTLSVRIPTKDYVKIIELAESKKLSTSEYVIYRLFKTDIDTTQLENEIVRLKASNEADQKTIADLKSTNEKWNIAHKAVSDKYADLVKRWNVQQEQLKTKPAPAGTKK